MTTELHEGPLESAHRIRLSGESCPGASSAGSVVAGAYGSRKFWAGFWCRSSSIGCYWLVDGLLGVLGTSPRAIIDGITRSWRILTDRLRILRSLRAVSDIGRSQSSCHACAGSKKRE